MKITEISAALTLIAAFCFLLSGNSVLACAFFCISALSYSRIEKNKE